jgi:carboxymethylenebutenolidase
VLDQIEATRAWLAGRPSVRAEAIGVMGFCMGGGFAVLAAGTGNFTVAAPFYADVPKDPRKLPKLCPTVASFGGKDARLAEAPMRLASHLERAGVEHDVVTYEHAGHSFMNHHPSWLVPIARALPMHAAYDERAAEDSYARVLAFFRKHLAA